MYIYACEYTHPDGKISYYVGKHEEPYEKSKRYLGSGKFCQRFKEKHGSEYTKKNVVKKILMHSLPNRKTLCQWEKIFIASYRQIYGSLCKNWTDGGEGFTGSHTKEAKKIIGEARKDKKIYTFRNVCTNQVFTGIQYDFTRKYGLHIQGVNKLVKGKINHHQYWVLNSSEIRSMVELLNANSVRQVYKRAYEAGDIKVTRRTFNNALKNPDHKRHDEFTKLYNKHSIKED